MTKRPRTLLSAAVLGTTLSLATATVGFAQPAPKPAPKPAPTPEAPKPDDKAGTNETLQNGTTGAVRPWAQGVSEADQKIALEMFQDGNKDLNDGAYVIAADKYRKALKVWDHPAINYNLALALLNLDQPMEVLEAFEKSIKYGAAPLEKEKFEKANEYIRLIGQQVAYIEISCQKPGADVLVDGKKVFTAPGTYKARVRVGKHVFAAAPGAGMGPGYIAKVNAPFIDANQTYRLELKMYTVEDLTRYKRKWDRTWAPWLVVGAGAAIAMTGGMLALSARSNFDDFDKKIAACNMESGNAGCDVMESGFGSLRDSGETKRTASYVMYGVGAATVVTGLALVLVNRRTSYQIREEDSELKGAGNVSIAPVVAPGLAGAMVHGSF